MTNLAVRLTPAALRQVAAGHPWVFDRSIRRITDGGSPGDLAVIFDEKRRFRAVGLFDPGSPIRIRILQHGQPATIDAAFFHGRVTEADDKRRQLGEGPWPTTGYRLVNGEGDGMGALIVDRYSSVAVVKVYSEAWRPHLGHVIDALSALPWCETIVVRGSRLLGWPTEVVRGQAVEPVPFLENGLQFEAAVLTGQKTGHFCDQRDNRRLVGERAAGGRVLDLFSCTGGFSLHAAAGQAAEVHAVDLSSAALGSLERQWERNDFGQVPLQLSAGDVFDVLDRERASSRRYDLVVVDPPSFAHRADQVGRAERAYRRLTEAALPLVEPGGWFFQASCSSRVTKDRFVDLVTTTAASHGHPLRDLEVTDHAVDHPVTFPEGAYLKAVFGRL